MTEFTASQNITAKFKRFFLTKSLPDGCLYRQKGHLVVQGRKFLRGSFFYRRRSQRISVDFFHGFPAHVHDLFPLYGKRNAITFQRDAGFVNPAGFPDGAEQAHHEQGQEAAFAGGQRQKLLSGYPGGRNQGIMVRDLAIVDYLSSCRETFPFS